MEQSKYLLTRQLLKHIMQPLRRAPSNLDMHAVLHVKTTGLLNSSACMQTFSCCHSIVDSR